RQPARRTSSRRSRGRPEAASRFPRGARRAPRQAQKPASRARDLQSPRLSARPMVHSDPPSTRIVATLYVRQHVVAPAPPKGSAPEGDTSLPAPATRAARLDAIRSHLRGWESTVALLLIAGVFSLIQAATPNIIG